MGWQLESVLGNSFLGRDAGATLDAGTDTTGRTGPSQTGHGFRRDWSYWSDQ